jgi:hypothetical protein
MAHPKTVATILVSSRDSATEKLKQLLIVSVLAIAVSACGSPVSSDVLAYDACIVRHPQEAAICEGPRQAYELDPTSFQERAVAIGLPADINYEERPAVAQSGRTPAPLRPSPIASGRYE